MYNLLYSIANPVGIIGVIIILIAYYYLSIDRWPAKSFRYQILNFLGAWMILYSLFFHWNISSVIIEIAWIIISMIGIYRWYMHKRKIRANLLPRAD